jgi:hypothetical protein
MTVFFFQTHASELRPLIGFVLAGHMSWSRILGPSVPSFAALLSALRGSLLMNAPPRLRRWLHQFHPMNQPISVLMVSFLKGGHWPRWSNWIMGHGSWGRCWIVRISLMGRKHFASILRSLANVAMAPIQATWSFFELCT